MGSARKLQHFTIYPLYILPRKLQIEPDQFLKCISITNVKKNTIETEWHGDTRLYSIIGDKVQGAFVQGRLLRLNKDIRSKLDLDLLKEDDLNLGPNQYVEEEAFFLLDTKLNIMMCEYNPSSLNVLSCRFEMLLNQVMVKCGLVLPSLLVRPIPSNAFIKRAVGSALIKRERVEFPELDLMNLEKSGVSSDMIKDLVEGRNFGINITIKYDVKPDLSERKFEKLRSLVDRVRSLASSFKVYTTEGNFDLIKENLLFYDFDVESRSNHDQMVRAIHEELAELHLQQMKEIMEIVTKFKTLDDYF